MTRTAVIPALLAAVLAHAPAHGAEDVPPITPEEVAALRAEIQGLRQEVAELKAQRQAEPVPPVPPAPVPTPAPAPSWKGAPQFSDKAGWSFKPRGRIQFDTAFIENPNESIITRNLGFNSRVRRIRLGVEGTIPGDFGYKFEMDFANGAVGFGDVILTYNPKDEPWSIILGNHETHDGLEQISSSRFLSFLERAQMNDAFVNTRRIGLSVGLQDKANVMRFAAGIFTGHTIDGGFDNDGWIAAARATYSPQALGGTVHIGANAQFRHFQSNAGATVSNSVNAPSTNQQARYRARPFLQTTDVRFVDTGAFAARSDTILGAELAGIFGPIHVAGEAQWTKVSAYSPGDQATGLDAFPTATFLVPSGDPSFFGWYAEAGYFLTGETRGYKNGLWDRTKVAKPLSKGGSGAFQINARYDYLDLNSRAIQQGFTNNFTTGTFAPSNNLGRGGTQSGMLASLIWIPEDYLRLLLQVSRVEVQGGPFAATVEATSTEPLDERSYGVNSVALRAQVDF